MMTLTDSEKKDLDQIFSISSMDLGDTTVKFSHIDDSISLIFYLNFTNGDQKEVGEVWYNLASKRKKLGFHHNIIPSRNGIVNDAILALRGWNQSFCEVKKVNSQLAKRLKSRNLNSW